MGWPKETYLVYPDPGSNALISKRAQSGSINALISRSIEDTIGAMLVGEAELYDDRKAIVYKTMENACLELDLKEISDRLGKDNRYLRLISDHVRLFVLII